MCIVLLGVKMGITIVKIMIFPENSHENQLLAYHLRVHKAIYLLLSFIFFSRFSLLNFSIVKMT